MEHSLLQDYLQKTPEDKQRSDVLAYLATLDHLKSAAPSIADNILNELKTQRSTLKLIASENYSSLTVQLAMGNLLTDKYCEGFPEHRFYAGCENVDAIELEAEKRAKLLFGTDHAYVQPHSGADANLVAFWAILSARVQTKEMEKLGQENPTDLSAEAFETIRQALCNQTLMGLSLGSGGHLTHGFKQNVSAKMFRAVTYDVSPSTHLLDYDKIAEIARREKPLILLAGYSAYPRRINFAKMRTIADEVGAVLMVDMAHFAGLVAGKAFRGDENPVPFAHILTSTTHKTLRGPRGGLVLCQQEFTDYVNKGCPYVLGGPLPHVIASKAIAFKEALTPSFQNYAEQIITNARTLAAGLQKRGISLVTGGTDNHLVLIDLTNLGITGRIAETALTEAGLTVNRNMVPFDQNGAWYTSGIRLGTPALTSLGMGSNEMDEVAEIIALVLNNTSSKIVEKTGKPSKARGQTQESILNEAKKHVRHLLDRFPLYPELTID
ncbi:MAG: Serine hydroxymethyltransferase [Chlamydiales bacterium]|nr:Serine hydroxymethyltransferase [Chlamydiales bacterium]